MSKRAEIVRGRNAERRRRVEEPRAVQVDGEAELARRRDDLVQLVERPHAPARGVVRVLEREDRRALVCHLRARLCRGAHLLRREPAAIAGQPERHQPGVGGRAAVLVDDDVRVLLRDQDVARPRVQLERDLVRHRRGRHEDRRLVAEQRRNPLLQRVDRRVLALLLVADGGLRDRAAHALGRLRDGVGAKVDHARDATVRRMDLALLESTLAERGEPAVPRASGLGVDDARRRVVRGDDDAAEGAAREPRGRGSVLDARGRHRARVARRDGQGALPHGRRAPGRGRAHALPRRPPLALSLVAVGLPAHVHVLRDRRDALRPEPHRLGDPRPGAPLPPARAGEPRRLHGHGRAVPQRRRRARLRGAAARPRDHASAYDDLHGRLDARPAPVRGRRRPADPARALDPCSRRRRSAPSSCR